MPLVATILQLDFMIHKESRLISNEVRQLFLSSLQTSACYTHAPAFQRIRFAFLLAAAILALSLLAGCADKKGVQDDDPVVASYGETEIRRSLVDYEKQNQQALSGGKAVSDQEAVDQLLENLAMLDEAEHLGLSVSQEEVDEAFAAQQQNYEEYEDVRTAVDAW